MNLHSAKRAWSLVGVLAAMLVLSAVVVFILRFNHQTELALLRVLDSHNAVRAQAWLLFQGHAETTYPMEMNTINGVPVLKIKHNEVYYYVIPPKTIEH